MDDTRGLDNRSEENANRSVVESHGAKSPAITWHMMLLRICSLSVLSFQQFKAKARLGQTALPSSWPSALEIESCIDAYID